MASRSIAIRITVDNQGAINATKAQILLTKELDDAVSRQAKNQVLGSKAVEAAAKAELAVIKTAAAEQKILANAVKWAAPQR